ncbi:unnamed protein product [Enterobius vermicularis]|uniref:Alpha-1,3-mannosyl-glycoprotein 4-beta-N-acetylglucosaminyltransferase A n=1 Tax=Enterobius vermicularis TaxID=51028 RepID=A0A0N4VI12_ENTVE|nr:unnamed protein product [Enterobius vermicularis]
MIENVDVGSLRIPEQPSDYQRFINTNVRRHVNSENRVLVANQLAPSVLLSSDSESLADGTITNRKNLVSYLPSILDDLPHLKNYLGNLQPSVQYPNGTVLTGFDVVIAIPTVERKGASYLLRTLQSIFFGLSKNSGYKVLVVVMIGAENGNSSDVQNQISSLSNQFSEYFSAGILHVIVPPKHWYPDDIRSIEPTLGDSPERMFWRTKQNLDYLYLMLFCEPLGNYYLQLEDDIITKAGFISTIMDKVRMQKSGPWFLIEFSSFGFIGKLFRSKDLRYLAQYIALLYRYKPVDWILDTIFYDRYCQPFEHPKNCSKAFRKYRVRGQTLFQHVGLTSSLDGKVQKLKEKTFKETMSFIPHHNPAANISSNIPHYLTYSFERFYNGLSPFCLGVLLRSGNAEHPDDVFDNTTIISWQSGEDDGVKRSFNFGDSGIARTTFDTSRKLKSITVGVTSAHNHWVILSELSIRVLLQ